MYPSIFYPKQEVQIHEIHKQSSVFVLCALWRAKALWCRYRGRVGRLKTPEHLRPLLTTKLGYKVSRSLKRAHFLCKNRRHYGVAWHGLGYLKPWTQQHGSKAKLDFHAYLIESLQGSECSGCDETPS